jgi:hypothetical protein
MLTKVTKSMKTGMAVPMAGNSRRSRSEDGNEFSLQVRVLKNKGGSRDQSILTDD